VWQVRQIGLGVGEERQDAVDGRFLDPRG